jgi:hypothetical protein
MRAIRYIALRIVGTLILFIVAFVTHSSICVVLALVAMFLIWVFK